MEFFIKCTSPDSAVCLKCGSKLILSSDQKTGRCGHCGSSMQVEFAEKVVVKENPPKKKDWVQMELF